MIKRFVSNLDFSLECKNENLNSYIHNIFNASLLQFPKPLPKKEMILIAIMLFIEWSNRTQEHGLEVKRWNAWVRRLVYIFVVLLLLRYANFGNNEFIYFQF